MAISPLSLSLSLSGGALIKNSLITLSERAQQQQPTAGASLVDAARDSHLDPTRRRKREREILLEVAAREFSPYNFVHSPLVSRGAAHTLFLRSSYLCMYVMCVCGYIHREGASERRIYICTRVRGKFTTRSPGQQCPIIALLSRQLLSLSPSYTYAQERDRKGTLFLIICAINIVTPARARAARRKEVNPLRARRSFSSCWGLVASYTYVYNVYIYNARLDRKRESWGDGARERERERDENELN